MRRRIAYFVLITVTAGLLVFLGRAAAFTPLRERVADSSASLLTFVRRGADSFRRFFGGPNGSRIQALEDERVSLLGEVARLEEAGRENETLRQAFALRQSGESGAIPATVIGFVREGRDEFLILDQGTQNGVGVGDVVIDRNSVLGGTVVEVGARSSRAILLTSASRSTEVTLPRINLKAIARGNNSRELIIDLVPGDADLHVGDLIIASPRATGGRRSLLIGEVRDVVTAEHQAFKTVRAVHLFDPMTDDVILLPAP